MCVWQLLFLKAFSYRVEHIFLHIYTVVFCSAGGVQLSSHSVPICHFKMEGGSAEQEKAVCGTMLLCMHSPEPGKKITGWIMFDNNA